LIDAIGIPFDMEPMLLGPGRRADRARRQHEPVMDFDDAGAKLLQQRVEEAVGGKIGGQRLGNLAGSWPVILQGLGAGDRTASGCAMRSATNSDIRRPDR